MRTVHQKYLDECRARRQKAVRLKKTGLSLKAIGVELGVTRERARQMIARETKGK